MIWSCIRAGAFAAGCPSGAGRVGRESTRITEAGSNRPENRGGIQFPARIAVARGPGMTPVESQNGKDVFDAAQAVAIRAELDRLLASSTFRAEGVPEAVAEPVFNDKALRAGRLACSGQKRPRGFAGHRGLPLWSARQTPASRLTATSRRPVAQALSSASDSGGNAVVERVAYRSPAGVFRITLAELPDA
jgi:hypothetical protein